MIQVVTHARTSAFADTQQQLARVAKALAHPVRVAISQLLASKTTGISGDIAAEFLPWRKKAALTIQRPMALMATH